MSFQPQRLSVCLHKAVAFELNAEHGHCICTEAAVLSGPREGVRDSVRAQYSSAQRRCSDPQALHLAAPESNTSTVPDYCAVTL